MAIDTAVTEPGLGRGDHAVRQLGAAIAGVFSDHAERVVRDHGQGLLAVHSAPGVLVVELEFDAYLPQGTFQRVALFLGHRQAEDIIARIDINCLAGDGAVDRDARRARGEASFLACRAIHEDALTCIG